MRQLAAVAVVFFGFTAGLTPLRTYDGWWHLATGRYICEHLSLPRVDVFSFTRAGQPWITHEWLWEILLYLSYARLGPLGVILLKSFISALIAWALFRLAVRRGSSTLLALLVTVLATLAQVNWLNGRPQILQGLFVLGALHLFQSYRKGSWRLMSLYPLLMVLWANCHASFPVGCGLFLLFGICELMRIPGDGIRRTLPVLVPQPSAYLMLMFALSVAACFINPHGGAGVLIPLKYVWSSMTSVVASIPEFQAPDWQYAGLAPFGLLILLCVAAMALSPRSPSPFDLLSVLGAVAMALHWVRNIPICVVIIAPVLAVHMSIWIDTLSGRALAAEERLRRTEEPHSASFRAFSWILVIVLVLTAAGQSLGLTRLERQIYLPKFPVKAAEFIDTNDLEGNMLNVYRWGGYLLWRFYGDRQVYIDGRLDVYGEQVAAEYIKVTEGRPGWLEVLNSRSIEYAVLDNAMPLCRLLELSGQFDRVYRDTQASIYVRSGGVNRQVSDRAAEGHSLLPVDDLPDRDAILGRAAP